MANLIQKTQMTRPEECTSSIELSIVTQQSTSRCQNLTSATTTPSPAASVILQENAAISITTPFQPIHCDFPKTRFGKQFLSCQGVWFRNFHGFIMMFLETVCCVTFACGRMQNFVWRAAEIKRILLLHQDSRTGNILWNI